jgi:serine/threonine protein kinase
MQHPFHLMPDMMVGPWRIVARLGAGGFGAVYRVEYEGEPYALKFAVHGPDSEDLNRTDERARRELACLLLIHHPHVVRVWSHGRWPHPRDGYHYVVMDYVEGLTLQQWVKQERPTQRQVLQLFSTLALTLEALHAQGIHHRDLKGSNILVRAKDGAPVLVDFGAAEDSAASGLPLTEGPLPPGTPHLRTPEALRFQREHYADLSARYAFRPTDDLYALGATLYEVLTGAPPFPPSLPREVLSELIETRMPASPETLNGQVSPELGALVMRLLAKRPEERFASGRLLHEQLQALLRDEAPNLDVSLQAGAETATTEGMGGSPVMFSADVPKRPLPGTEEWGGARASPGLASVPREASAPTVLTERASPGSPSHRRRAWLAVAAPLLLALLGVGLWRAVTSSARRAELPAEPPAPERLQTASVADAGLPLHASPGTDGGPDVAALGPADAGPLVVAEALPSPPPKKGPLMRKNPPAKSPDVPPESAQPQRPGSRAAGPLAGALAAACVAGTAGCASPPPPPMRYGPPPFRKCPPGSVETMRGKLSFTYEKSVLVLMPGATPEQKWDPVLVREGDAEVIALTGDWMPGVPPRSVLVGEFTFGDRLYGRFWELRLPSGERLPLCAALYEDWGSSLGVPWEAGSVPGAMKVKARQVVTAELLSGEH